MTIKFQLSALYKFLLLWHTSYSGIPPLRFSSTENFFHCHLSLFSILYLYISQARPFQSFPQVISPSLFETSSLFLRSGCQFDNKMEELKIMYDKHKHNDKLVGIINSNMDGRSVNNEITLMMEK